MLLRGLYQTHAGSYLVGLLRNKCSKILSNQRFCRSIYTEYPPLFDNISKRLPLFCPFFSFLIICSLYNQNIRSYNADEVKVMIYDDESAEKLFLEAKSVYEDRGMLKWLTGFFLSDHTAAMQKDVAERSRVNEQKPQMYSHEIQHVLEHARLKRRPVAIQLEQLDMEGKYLDDVVGMIKGYDELGIYIGDQKVDYDEIRHVELYDWHKWSELK